MQASKYEPEFKNLLSTALEVSKLTTDELKKLSVKERKEVFDYAELILRLRYQSNFE